jgi:hypothetical protein
MRDRNEDKQAQKKLGGKREKIAAQMRKERKK